MEEMKSDIRKDTKLNNVVTNDRLREYVSDLKNNFSAETDQLKSQIVELKIENVSLKTRIEAFETLSLNAKIQTELSLYKACSALDNNDNLK